MPEPVQNLPFIHIKGAREHNLKNIELRIPRGQMVVITGVSGSGKSSLAFDTLYAEGYRKYMDSLSTGVRSLLEQVKRPEVDFIHGLSPVIAIEQREAGDSNPRDTVATVTEIADYARLLWALCGQASCPLDGGVIQRRSLDDCVNQLMLEPAGTRVMLLAPYLKAKPSILRDELPHLRQRGFQRVRIAGQVRDLDERDVIPSGAEEVQVDLLIDRLVIAQDQRARLTDSLELALREGKDRALALVDRNGTWEEKPLSQHLACVICGTVYPTITPRFFSYNHPDGACPDCGGLGRTLQFMPDLVVPDATKSVKGGAIKPLRIGSKRIIVRHNALLRQLAEQLPFDPDVPWQDLPEQTRQQLLFGTGERQFLLKLLPGNRKPVAMPFGGIMAELNRERLETSSEALKARLMAYQLSSECQSCGGRRLSPLALKVTLAQTDYAAFMSRDIESALEFVDALPQTVPETRRLADALNGLRDRLRFLKEVGLGYLTLQRAFNTLSGGEAQRVRLATQLGMGLTGVLYVLDEPSVGLHPHDNNKLIATLLDLRNRGNSVIVVEHDADTMHAADHLIEMGPGAGQAGGALVFEGKPAEAQNCPHSRTGAYLSGTIKVCKNTNDRLPGNDWLVVKEACENNLRHITTRFPVGLLTCVTGVSGSGKSTLINDILARAASVKLHRARTYPGKHKQIQGLEYFVSVVQVDQDPIGRSHRSNPATYTKLFDELRALYAMTSLAKVRGYGPSRFSFNVRGGRCERCMGDGVIQLDMRFLADVYVECPSCHGQRYNRETLEIRYKGYSIAEALNLSVDEALVLFRSVPKIASRLQTLQQVGLGYLKLGQPATTLSGGEAQRLKLSSELSRRQQGQTLYILDEPTTGLHWDDIQRLLDLLFQLRDAGNTVIIIEHNLDVIRMADWVVDLGPGGGKDGGMVTFEGRVADLMKHPTSLTAMSLRSSP
ncbi:MAG: excinuclease ABC subunit UvrA [Verrucomicrobiota bacterium]|nr:excinuclease ABC subunit UvrA [Verrucomicrobiota bacterium]